MRTLILSMLVGVCLAGLVDRDTLDALKQLHLTDFMSTLTTDQQLLMIDMVAHAEAGTLTDFINTIGYSRILEIFIALSADDERTVKNYVIQRLTLEAQGPINAHHGVATGHGQ